LSRRAPAVLHSRDLGDDIELASVSGVLSEHVEARPLKRRWILDEPPAKGSASIEVP